MFVLLRMQLRSDADT